MHNINIRLTGSGGQGLILAGIIMAEAAIFEGKNAVQTQSYGPEARGGASKAEVIISGSEIEFPKVEVPNILLCMTQKAYEKYAADLDGDGFLIVDDSLEIGDTICKTIKAPIIKTAIKKFNKSVVANMIALGILNEITGAVSNEALEQCMLDRVPKGTEKLNLEALEAGRELAKTCKVEKGEELTQSMSLEDRIKYFYSKLSKNQKLLADFIMENSTDVLFLKAYNLGKEVGVSASTVGRFAQFIGYEDYKDMQKALAKNFKNKLSSLERYQIGKNSKLTSNELEDIIIKDIDNLKKTLELNDFDRFENISNSIQKAKRVYIVGQRSSKVLAEYLAFYLNFIRSDVKIIPSGAGDLMDELIHINKNDVLIAFSFPRYAKRTYDAIDFAKQRGAKIIAMTDAFLSPMMDYADEVLVAEFGMSTFIDSMTAPLSLINALILSLSKNNTSVIGDNFTLLEELWQKYDIYQK